MDDEDEGWPRLDDDTERELRAYADERGLSRTEALQEWIEHGRDVATADTPDLAATDDLSRVVDLVDDAERIVDEYHRKVSAQQSHLRSLLADHVDLADVDAEHVDAFAEQPYKLLPRDEDEYYVVAPRFVPFSVGHLLEQDDAWSVFVINKYVGWIEDLPTDLREKIDIEPRYEEAVVEDGTLELADSAERERAWDDLEAGDRLAERVGEDKIELQPGAEFEVIADLIEAGNLPFAATRIPDVDLRDDPEGVSLRPYQERAWEQFREYGQIGVYWPPGLGKTYFSLYAGERIVGDKLVVVPSSTLESQWRSRIYDHCEHGWEWDVRTYQHLTTGDNIQAYTGEKSPTLTIFDEAHALPADTHARLATIDTDYRIGLSATPYREDERTDYIFALTGTPVGIEWEELVQYGDVEYPTVSVYLYGTQAQKRADLEQLVAEGVGKTLVFCDSIEHGEELAAALDVPFVHGETPTRDRLSLFREHNVVIGSRVADEGLSLDDLDRVIEYDFHGGSRRQELQRAGRLMHADGLGQHIVQMTDEEYENYGRRLYSLEEKGMDIRIERRA